MHTQTTHPCAVKAGAEAHEAGTGSRGIVLHHIHTHAHTHTHLQTEDVVLTPPYRHRW